jgi:hypothetical protein
MHTYQPRWADEPEARTLPDLGAFRFTNPLDVAAYAEVDWLLTWRTYPDVWHLAESGAFRCSSKGSSLDSVRTFAEEPDRMLACRMVDLDHPCPDRWLVIEPRHEWLGDRYQVDEGDAQAFLSLRRSLAGHGITLLDVMVFDQEFHWWSLHELTSGSTAWS